MTSDSGVLTGEATGSPRRVLRREWLWQGLALLILALMFWEGVTSARDDSATSDELVHILAGYSYLTQQDYRLNAEHPPLVKDLAALMLLRLGLPIPSDLSATKATHDSPWPVASAFVYGSSQDPERILFRARLPVMFLMVLLGYYLFRWTRALSGSGPALLALILYAWSPTVLAHGRLVTTDLAAAAGFFIGCYYFLGYLEQPTRKHLIGAGVAMGLAQLTKFSVAWLVPYLLLIAVLHFLAGRPPGRPARPVSVRVGACLRAVLPSYVAILAIAYAVVGLVYLHHTWHYSLADRIADIDYFLADSWPVTRRALRALAALPVLQVYSSYVQGLLMTWHRVGGGTPTYFLGTVSLTGHWYYFPLVYLIKEPVALHLLTLTALAAWVARARVARRVPRAPTSPRWPFLGERFIWLALFIGGYWAVALRSGLNIGIRHILPTFPFLYLLIGIGLFQLGAHLRRRPSSGWRIAYRGVIFALFLWYVAVGFRAWPSYLAYFNEWAGGPENGYRYVVDSNLDWGQDLKRLAVWVRQQQIPKIQVEYFGGGGERAVRYYLGSRFEPLQPEVGSPRGWIAISATLYQGSRGQPDTNYDWLDPYAPVAKIGYSIFVYHIPE